MVLTESLKFVAATVLCLRAIVKAAITYVANNKSVSSSQLKGTGLGKSLPESLPSAVEIKRALPKHCFQPTVRRSMSYAIWDIAQVAVTFVVFVYVDRVVNVNVLRWALTVLYWAVQGTFFTALFVIGHDCGHESFSDHRVLNDVVGNVMHGFLLCPYYMWKLSHRVHHKNNANIDKDEVFYPVKRSEPTSSGKVLPGFGFGTGWFGYLLLGYNPRPVRHFWLFDALFHRHLINCCVSLLTVFLMSYCLYMFYGVFGLSGLIVYYGLPLFIFASYTVIITFLHHNELHLPWYADSEWDFVRGQLSSIDRHYGIVHNIIHSIGTHQMHHMFTKIPHYHLEEATASFRKAFPDLVKVCEEPILPSFVRMFQKYEEQGVIDDGVLVHRYK